MIPEAVFTIAEPHGPVPNGWQGRELEYGLRGPQPRADPENPSYSVSRCI